MQHQNPQKLAVLRIFLVRHGLSEDNLNSIWAGHKDSPLSPTGILQAKALGAALANQFFGAIYSSDLKRASRTAEEILQANKSTPPPPLVQTQSLREQNFGQAEGKSWSDAEFAITTHGEDARNFRFPDGESLDDVNNRMGISLRRYVLPRLEALRTKQERDEPQIVIVAHGIAIAELLRVLMKLHDTSGSSPWPDPQETYTRVKMENTGWTLVELAVPFEQGEDKLEKGKRPTYTRITQQNNTDHLHGLPSTANGSSTDAARKLSSAGVNSFLGGGLVAAEGSTGLQMREPRATNAYDAKYMMRELERAGSSTAMLSGTTLGSTSAMLASSGTGSEGMMGQSLLPSTSTPTILSSPSQSVMSAPSLAALSPSPNPSLIIAPSAWSDLWQSICVRILPLFNDEELKGHVEDINDSVSSHIQRTLDRSPARAIDSLSKDLYAVCATGMYTLNARLNKYFQDDFRLIEALTEVWTTFFTKILPWLEACFLPLQTDSTLASLSKGDDKPLSSLQTEPINIRKVALIAFRDQILLPWFDRFQLLFIRVGEFDIDIIRQTRRLDVGTDQETEDRVLYPRLMQMTNLVGSVQTNDDTQSYIDELLKSLRNGHEIYLAALNPHQHGGMASHARDVSGSSAVLTATRDKRTNARHGWLPASAAKHGNRVTVDSGKENAYLSSLRSPTVEEAAATTSDSVHALEDGSQQGPRASLDDSFKRAIHVDDVDSYGLSTSSIDAAPVAQTALGLGRSSLDETWDGTEEQQYN